MRFLTGSDVKRVFAEVAHVAHGAAEDLLCATLRFERETIGMLDVNWLTPTKVREISATGENGVFVVDYLTQGLRFHQHVRAHTDWDALAGFRGAGQGDVIEYGLQRREPLVVEWRNFLAAMSGEEADYATGEDALAALAAIEAIHASVQDHEARTPSALSFRDPA
jgi:predicted dehydrogenase